MFDDIADYFADELDAAFAPFVEAGHHVNVSAAWSDTDPDMVRLIVLVDCTPLIDLMVCGTCQGPLETIQSVLTAHAGRIVRYLLDREAKQQIVVPVIVDASGDSPDL